jgi:hypothetical protein
MIASDHEPVIAEPAAAAWGIPVPPGYVSEPTDFDSPSGQDVITQAISRLAKSITYTPLVMSFISCLMMFFFGRSMMMFLNAAITILGSGLSAIPTAVSANHRLSGYDRITMLAIGFGLMAFIVWRAIVTRVFSPSDGVPASLLPVFFEIH